MFWSANRSVCRIMDLARHTSELLHQYLFIFPSASSMVARIRAAQNSNCNRDISSSIEEEDASCITSSPRSWLLSRSVTVPGSRLSSQALRTASRIMPSCGGIYLWLR